MKNYSILVDIFLKSVIQKCPLHRDNNVAVIGGRKADSCPIGHAVPEISSEMLEKSFEQDFSEKYTVW
jgi:hypothetical protein